MAFRQSEIRMVLGIQSYGTANLTRLRRDINALGRTVDLAQANQTRTAERAASQMERVASTRASIQNKQANIARKIASAEMARVAGLERVAARRTRLERAADSVATRAASKRLQIAGTEARIASGREGAGQLRQQIARMGISDRLARHADRRVALAQKEMTLQERIRTNRATQLGLEQRLSKMQVPDAKVAEYRQANANLGNMGKTMRQVVLRLQAADIRASRLQRVMRGVKNQTEMLASEALTLNRREQKVLATINEQLGVMTRQDQLLKIQNSQLAGIEARQADIAAELKVIAAEEGRINTLNKTRLAEIDATKAGLAAETLELREQEAILRRILGEEMQRARMQDAQAMRMQKLQKREVVGRTVSHVGRTAQFGGLIATAGFAAAGAAAAEFDRKAMLAGTQMRNVTGSFEQAAARGKELKTVILGMMERFPSDAEEMADSAYEIFSSMNLVENGVVKVQKGYGLMATATKMAVAGQVDLGEATSAMITVLNNFDPRLQHVNQTMNEVFAIVRFGQMRLSDFAAAMVPLAPVANSVGLSLTDVGAALASLTIVMKSPQQAAQGLARAIELLQLEPFQKGLHAAGVEVTDLETKRMRPLMDIFTDMRRQMPELGTSQKSMVQALTQLSKVSGMTKAGIQGTVQARRAMANLLMTMELYQNILANIEGDQGEFNKAFQAMKDTPGVQWAIFVNQMKAFALTVGQAALPALLKLGEWLVKAAHWIEDMIKKTDGAAIKWAVFGAAALLVGGTLVNIIGSLIALSANMRIATASMEVMGGAAGKASIAVRLLNASLLVLGGIGIIAIPIVLQIIKGGEPGLWDFLGAAGAGAMGGAMIGGAIGGPLGAGVGAAAGAVTVPLVVHLVAKLQGPDPKDIEPAKAAWSQYLKSSWGDEDDLKRMNKQYGFAADNRIHTQEEFLKKFAANQKKFKIPAIGEDVAMQTKANLAKPKTLLQQYQEYVKRFTAEQIDAQNAWFDDMAAGEDKADTAARLAKARSKVISDAFENMQDKIDQAVDKLGGVYDKFLNQNKELFGQLGQGPVMTGMLGSMFTDINEMLMQFGQSVPIPMNIINQDLEMQMANFSKLREGYATLLKKGVPLEVVQQLQQMGMAGLPFVQGLVQASGPEFQKWIKNVQDSHDDIVKATEIDFDAQLKQWMKYGSDIATKIIDGLSSEAAQAVLKEGFRDNVIKLFGDTFREEMAVEIAAGMKEIADAEKARIAAEKKAKAAAKAAQKARGKPPLAGKEPQVPDEKSVPKGAPPSVQGPVSIRSAVGLPPLLTPGGKINTPRTVINNYGDRNQITASGVTPGGVTRAMNKKSFTQRNRRPAR